MEVPFDTDGALEDRLQAVDSVLEEQLAGGDPPYLHDAARHLVEAGGKRLRPIVLLLFADAVDPELDDGAVVPAAAAVELVHTLSLIHDDIIDADDLRRGVPSVHTSWDEPTGIVAGDLLFAQAFSLVSRAEAPPAVTVECTRVLADACEHLSEGQARDMALSDHEGVSEEVYLQTIADKAGALFAASAEMGARLAGGDETVAAGAAGFGRAVGTAFQLHDDVLDVTGSTAHLGKPVGSDLTGGKPTLVSAHGAANGVDVTPKRASDGGTDTCRDDLESAGSLEYVNRLANRHVGRALSALEVVPRTSARQRLADIAAFAVERRR